MTDRIKLDNKRLDEIQSGYPALTLAEKKQILEDYEFREKYLKRGLADFTLNEETYHQLKEKAEKFDKLMLGNHIKRNQELEAQVKELKEKADILDKINQMIEFEIEGWQDDVDRLVQGYLKSEQLEAQNKKILDLNAKVIDENRKLKESVVVDEKCVCGHWGYQHPLMTADKERYCDSCKCTKYETELQKYKQFAESVKELIEKKQDDLDFKKWSNPSSNYEDEEEKIKELKQLIEGLK